MIQPKYFADGFALAVSAAGLCAWGIAHPKMRKPLTRLGSVTFALALVLVSARFMELSRISLGSFLLYWAAIWITLLFSIRFLLLPFGIDFRELLSPRRTSEGLTQPEVLRREAICIGTVVRPTLEMFGFFLMTVVFWTLATRHASGTFIGLSSDSVIGTSLIFVSISSVVWFLSWNRETRESFKTTSAFGELPRLLILGLPILFLWGIYFAQNTDEKLLWTICILFLGFVTAAFQRLSKGNPSTTPRAVTAPTQRFNPKWTSLYVLLLLFVAILMGGVFSLTLGASY